jgi:Na+-driven multidrug efflux pump
MTEHQRKYVRVLAASLLVNVVLSFALIPLFGALGAAYAKLVAQVVLYGANAIVVAQLLKINATIFNPKVVLAFKWNRQGLRELRQAVFARNRRKGKEAGKGASAASAQPGPAVAE